MLPHALRKPGNSCKGVPEISLTGAACNEDPIFFQLSTKNTSDISDKPPGNDKAIAGLPLLICTGFLIHATAGPLC